MPPVLDDAVCIRHWDWSETSQTVTLLTRMHGVVRGLAKGSKRPKGPFSGGIELLSRGAAGLILRPSSELALISEWDLSQSFPALRESLAAYHAALYFADLTQQFVHDHDAHPALFDGLVLALNLLRSDEPVWRAVVGFQWTLLREAGFRPELFLDVRTGEALDHPEPTEPGETPSPADAHPAGDRTATYLFDPEGGGLAGPETAARAARSTGAPAGVWKVRASTIDFLRALAQSTPGDVLPPPTDPQSVERAARLLGSYVRHILGRQPPTHESLFGPQGRSAG